MRKIHAALLAGAVVVGLGAVAGLATFAPSLTQNADSHELTLQLPGGGTETVAYTGNVAPKVSFHTQEVAAFWPAPFFYDWTMPSLVAIDPFIANMNRHLDMLATTPLLIPSAPDQPLSAAALSNLPAGTSYSMVSATIGNGVCTRFTHITKVAGDAQPKIVSQNTGNCGAGSKQAVTSQPTQAAKAINLRTTTGPATTQNM
jgi:hypothetical protein